MSGAAGLFREPACLLNLGKRTEVDHCGMSASCHYETNGNAANVGL